MYGDQINIVVYIVFDSNSCEFMWFIDAFIYLSFSAEAMLYKHVLHKNNVSFAVHIIDAGGAI